MPKPVIISRSLHRRKWCSFSVQITTVGTESSKWRAARTFPRRSSATEDAVIAAHTACIAAESLGIGSCYIGDIVENFEIHKELLNLPPQVAPLCMLVFGYPTQQQKERKQTTRFAKSSIVFENRYRELSEEELLEMMPNDRTKAFYNRKYVSEFAQEMVRSTKEIYKNWNSKE